MTPQQLLDNEAIVAPDISHLVIEDDTPVDNFQSAKQQRLLVEVLYSSDVLPLPFIADTNVGLFYAPRQSAVVVPDAFLSLGVQMPSDWSEKKNRSYFVWEFEKVPEVCIEIVSNREGNELESKKATYARLGVPYYAVFDPLRQLQKPDEMNGSVLKVWALSVGRYTELPPSQVFWFETVGLGLTLWDGVFEGQQDSWLRWCRQDGRVIPTGKERADQAQQKTERLAERLRQMGVDPDAV